MKLLRKKRPRWRYPEILPPIGLPLYCAFSKFNRINSDLNNLTSFGKERCRRIIPNVGRLFCWRLCKRWTHQISCSRIIKYWTLQLSASELCPCNFVGKQALSVCQGLNADEECLQLSRLTVSGPYRTTRVLGCPLSCPPKARNLACFSIIRTDA